MSLRLFLDTADPNAWAEWMPSGLFYGITTNPTLLQRAGQACTLNNLRHLTREALALGSQEVHLQAWGGDAEAYYASGCELAAIAPRRIWVKLPITRDGAAAAQRLIRSGINVTFTACYEPAQVLIAAALGADYIAPYLGRICDQGRDGHDELIAMQQCLNGARSPLRLLVASLRQPADVTRLAAAGLDTFTLSPAIAAAMFDCEATRQAARQFETDASVPG